MAEGKLFQMRAAATEKERSPMVEWRATGTLSVAVDEDRRRCRAGIPFFTKTVPIEYSIHKLLRDKMHTDVPILLRRCVCKHRPGICTCVWLR